MITLQATGDIRKVSIWLGHAGIQTTEMYTRADLRDLTLAIADYNLGEVMLRRGEIQCVHCARRPRGAMRLRDAEYWRCYKCRDLPVVDPFGRTAVHIVHELAQAGVDIVERWFEGQTSYRIL
jgi:hypothetical protein